VASALAVVKRQWDEVRETLAHLTWPPVEQIAKLCAVVLLVGAVVLSAVGLFDDLCVSLVFALLPQLRGRAG